MRNLPEKVLRSEPTRRDCLRFITRMGHAVVYDAGRIPEDYCGRRRITGCPKISSVEIGNRLVNEHGHQLSPELYRG